MVVATCYGCGAPLQTSDSDAQGYVDIETNELKKKHHQLRTILCGRCRLLSHGHMITAVGGNGGYSGGKQFVTAEQLSEKLSHLRYEKALIVKLAIKFARSPYKDSCGPSLTARIRTDSIKFKRSKCPSDKFKVFGWHSGSRIRNSKGKKGQKDPVAAAAQKYKPIQSAVPGTTLSPIQINASLGGGYISTIGKLQWFIQKIYLSLLPKAGLGVTLFLILRIDILKVLPETCLTFYGPKALRIHMAYWES
nr:isoform 2 of no-associated protein 1, chloroplastic/mitochondrial [Quercus suber]